MRTMMSDRTARPRFEPAAPNAHTADFSLMGLRISYLYALQHPRASKHQPTCDAALSLICGLQAFLASPDPAAYLAGLQR